MTTLYQTLVKIEEDRNKANRYKARKKYYDKESNKIKKRMYMKEYSQRPEVITRRRKYALVYQATPKSKAKRHEWYIRNKTHHENDELNIINSERFTNYGEKT